MLLNFNSTMVRLKGHPLPAANGARTFQFHYGTIKSSHAARIHGLSFYFNSTMVRLKVHRVCPMRYPKKDFNSTMVRLKVTCVYHISMSREFQFHYGTIKRPRRGCKADAWRYFNSTMVRLKDNFTSHVPIGQPYFNSTMVRLKAPVGAGGAVRTAFQFHYGTIKSPSRYGKRLAFDISIPLWYD